MYFKVLFIPIMYVYDYILIHVLTQCSRGKYPNIATVTINGILLLNICIQKLQIPIYIYDYIIIVILKLYLIFVFNR